MQSRNFFIFSMAIFSFIAFLMSINIYTSDKELMHFCQKGCWLNRLLLALFGEIAGKNILASIWLLGAFLPIFSYSIEKNEIPIALRK